MSDLGAGESEGIDSIFLARSLGERAAPAAVTAAAIPECDVRHVLGRRVRRLARELGDERPGVPVERRVENRSLAAPRNGE